VLLELKQFFWIGIHSLFFDYLFRYGKIAWFSINTLRNWFVKLFFSRVTFRTRLWPGHDVHCTLYNSLFIFLSSGCPHHSFCIDSIEKISPFRI
jgi:hypothetical protein